jgi:hypothetical protein
LKEEFSEEDQNKILALYNEKQDLNYITQKFTGDPNTDGRTKIGRRIRSFLAGEGKDYGVRGGGKKGKLDLTEEQMKFLNSDIIDNKMSPIEITRLVFKNADLKPLGQEHRTILSYLEEYRPDVVDHTATVADGKWYKPKNIEKVIGLVNKWCNLDLPCNKDKLPNKARKGIERLFDYLNVYKLWTTINCLKTDDDRNLFESEFIRYTWDKPDLTNEELNLYMMVCSNIVRAKHIQNRMDTFLTSLEDKDEGAEVSIKQTEHLKTLNDELNACEKRISDTISKLNGDRSKRVEKLQSVNANILSLVEAFQEKESRDLMIMMADKLNKLIEEEAGRFESVSEFSARIFGISPDELI